MLRHRPVKARDGAGGFLETFDPALDLEMWGTLELHENRITCHVDSMEDIVVSDVIEVADEQAPPPVDILVVGGDVIVTAGGNVVTEPVTRAGAQYRVTASVVIPRGRERVLTLERMQRPIVPQ